MTKQGPNVRRLICHKMALLAVPVGTKPGEGLKKALESLLNRDKTVLDARTATDWVERAIAVVKTAPDNPYKDDEAIAGEILCRLKLKECKVSG